MRLQRDSRCRPGKVLVKLVWKDASGFLSLLNASRESAVTARTANLPVHGFFFAAAGQVQNVRVLTYVQAGLTGQCCHPIRVAFWSRTSPPSQSIRMIIDVVTS